MHFGENQLSRSLIGLSPLPTAHPPSFQPRWVRSSTRSYTCFNLAMDRSLRFGSRSCHYNALFRLAFATTTPHGLTSRQNTNSQAHSSKGTPPPHTKGGAITACKHTVSGTISLPSRGTFHHSLTVLSTIGHQEVFRQPSGLGRFTQDSTSPVLLGQHHPRHTPTSSAYGGITHYATPSQTIQLPASTRAPSPAEEDRTAPQPRTRNPCRVSHAHGLTIIRFRSPLLTEYLLLRVLRCFTSPRHPPHPIQFRCR